MKFKLDTPRRSVGLHFDGQQIWGVRLRCDNQHIHLETAATTRFDGPLGEAESVKAVRSLLNQLELVKGCPIHITATFDNFHSTHLTTGESPLSQMNKMAHIAYQQEIGTSIANFTFDYERVATIPDAMTPQVTLHAFSVETSRKDAVCHLLETAGAHPASLIPTLFAYRNLIATHDHTAPTAILILDSKELRIGVVHNKKFIFTRTFKSGLDSALDYISQKTDSRISSAELERALDHTAPQFHSQLHMEIRAAFAYITERMQEQVDRAFKFYSGRLKLPPIDTILVHASSRIIAQSMAALLGPNYNHPVDGLTLEQFAAIETAEIFFNAKNDPEYTLALGAGLSEIQRCPDLLYTHDDQLGKRKTYLYKTALTLTLSTLGIICLSIFVAQMALLAPRMIKKNELEEQLTEHPSMLTEELIRSKIKLSESRLKELHRLAERYALQGYFYELCRLMPAELKIEYAHLERSLEPPAPNQTNNTLGTLSLRGIVIESGLRQQALLTKFLVETGSSPLFKNLKRETVPPSELDAYAELGVTPFRFSCDLIYGKGKQP